eukprot:jgi/Ulvmu1/4934/UM204_0006.1
MDGATRLVDGSSGPGFEYGRLEIFEHGFWSNVCNNDRFTPDAAQVACKAFGYDGGAALRFTQSYAESLSQVLFENLPVALAAVDCDGTETSISECQSNDGLIGACTNITSSTVLACGNTAEGCERQEGTTEGAVRLRGGFGTLCDPIHTGFVEVLHFDEWGSICTDQFSENRAEDNLVADVVCRQLGFPHGTRVDPLTARPPPPTPDPDVAPSPYSSYYYGNYYDYSSITEEAEEPVDRFWLSSVMCNGPEGRLIDCDLGQGFRNNNAGCNSRPHRIHIACRQFPVVEALEEITSDGAAEGDLRLIEEAPVANWMTGRLQVFFEGSWSQVCAGSFMAPDANVACRQLGFGAGTIVPQFLSDAERVTLQSTPVFPEIAISASRCAGTEERLLDCSGNLDPDFFFTRDCLSSSGLGLAIGCVGTPGGAAEGEFRLTDTSPEATPDSESGILEVFHAGAWGTLCSGDFGILESTAEIACRDMGFVTGFFEAADQSPALLPPWLSGIRCAGPEASVGACRRSGFGDTSTCGAVQRLFCLSSRQSNGQVRLADGSADAGGSWEYGRLEVLINSVWSLVDDRNRQFGRRSAQVACRTLGFAAGAQILAGDSSPFPAPSTAANLIRDITCDGTEATLSACDIDTFDSSDYFYFYDYSGSDFVRRAAALVCTTPSGCEASATPPAEGDVRLVPLNGTDVPTAACDDVHFGGVELFREGQWGRICAGRFGGEQEDFTLDAQVVCRQLGFPFGTIMDEREAFGVYDYNSYDYDAEPVITWATEVVCTGKEERLLDCEFPQDFGVDYSSPYDYYGGYNENWPAPAHAAPEPAPMEMAPPPAGSLGLPFSRCERSDRNRLSVVCRRFEITESEFIRR